MKRHEASALFAGSCTAPKPTVRCTAALTTAWLGGYYGCHSLNEQSQKRQHPHMQCRTICKLMLLAQKFRCFCFTATCLFKKQFSKTSFTGQTENAVAHLHTCRCHSSDSVHSGLNMPGTTVCMSAHHQQLQCLPGAVLCTQSFVQTHTRYLSLI